MVQISEMITLRNLARIIGVSRQTIYRWMEEASSFPTPIRFGQRGTIRFYKDEVIRYIEEKRKNYARFD